MTDLRSLLVIFYEKAAAEHLSLSANIVFRSCVSVWI